jgi:glycolate oxidase FAD binding subunit
LRLRYGSIRDLIIGITVALPDGTLARSGGKVVKNVAGYDLQKLMTGALGTLGIITLATFRLHPLPRESQTLSFNCADASEANRLILAVMDSMLVSTGLQLRISADSEPQVDIRLDGIKTGIEAQRDRLAQMTADVGASDADENVWRAREELWKDTESSLICKLSVLPSQLSAATSAIERLCSSPQLSWRVVAQSTGLATVRIAAHESEQLQFALNGIRGAIRVLGGTVVVLLCPAELKKQIDVWGPTGDAQQLMVRVKQQFDPRGILNRGRFVGGI